jgi:hypothetical protein
LLEKTSDRGFLKNLVERGVGQVSCRLNQMRNLDVKNRIVWSDLVGRQGDLTLLPEKDRKRRKEQSYSDPDYWSHGEGQS